MGIGFCNGERLMLQKDPDEFLLFSDYKTQ